MIGSFLTFIGVVLSGLSLSQVAYQFNKGDPLTNDPYTWDGFETIADTTPKMFSVIGEWFAELFENIAYIIIGMAIAFVYLTWTKRNRGYYRPQHYNYNR